MLYTYDLVILDDEAVALSGSIPSFLSTKSPLFLSTLLMVMLVSAVILGAIYAIRLQHYQSRLELLSESGIYSIGEYNNRSIKSIRHQIEILEENLAEGNLGGFVPMM